MINNHFAKFNEERLVLTFILLISSIWLKWTYEQPDAIGLNFGQELSYLFIIVIINYDSDHESEIEFPFTLKFNKFAGNHLCYRL